MSVGWHNNDAIQPLTILGEYLMYPFNVNISVTVQAWMKDNTEFKNANTNTNTNTNTNANVNVNAGMISGNNSNIVLALRLGGTLSANNTGCRNNIRERVCVEAMGNNWFDFGYFFQIQSNGYWQVLAGKNRLLKNGFYNQSNVNQNWFEMSFLIQNYTMYGLIDQNIVFRVSDDITDMSNRFENGWVGVSCGWQLCQFQELQTFNDF